jgi:hypothetical protein
MKNNIRWKLKDKDELIEELGLSNFVKKYKNEILIDIIKSLKDDSEVPSYLYKVKTVFEKDKYLDKLYKAAA